MSARPQVVGMWALIIACNATNFGARNGGAREPAEETSTQTSGATATETAMPQSDVAVEPSTATEPALSRAPSDAVTKGSFAVWSEPRDPVPGETYFIVIEVRLPPGFVGTYSLFDLTGAIRGTDGYTQLIGAQTSESYYPEEQTLEVYQGFARVAVHVPGASELVRDTIEVRSQLLNETQTIELIF